MTDTTQTSTTFTGEDGHSYGFYSIATDNVGNRQPNPGAAQATTTVDAAPPPAASPPCPRSARTFMLSWSGSDTPGGSGLASYSIYVSDNGGPFTPLILDTTDTSMPFTGQDGHTYGFYSVATDNVGNLQPTPSAAQASTEIVGPETTTAANDASVPFSASRSIRPVECHRD